MPSEYRKYRAEAIILLRRCFTINSIDLWNCFTVTLTRDGDLHGLDEAVSPFLIYSILPGRFIV